MSEEGNKTVTLNINDLSYFNDKMVTDLTRYLAEALPQLNVTRNGSELEIIMPTQLSKRVIRLRIKKFLHKNKISNDFRPISSKEGYIMKEKKSLELSYY